MLYKYKYDINIFKTARNINITFITNLTNANTVQESLKILIITTNSLKIGKLGHQSAS